MSKVNVKKASREREGEIKGRLNEVSVKKSPTIIYMGEQKTQASFSTKVKVAQQYCDEKLASRVDCTI